MANEEKPAEPAADTSALSAPKPPPPPPVTMTEAEAKAKEAADAAAAEEKEAAKRLPTIREHMDAAKLEYWQRQVLLSRRDLLEHDNENSRCTEEAFKAALERALHGGA